MAIAVTEDDILKVRFAAYTVMHGGPVSAGTAIGTSGMMAMLDYVLGVLDEDSLKATLHMKETAEKHMQTEEGRLAFEEMKAAMVKLTTVRVAPDAIGDQTLRECDVDIVQ